jgi:choloylglycine hydrolase
MKIAPLLAAISAVLFVADSAPACTRIFWNDNGEAMVVVRTMDLYRTDKAKLVVYPRGLSRDGLQGGKGNSLKWTSKYGSVAVTAFGRATSDGMNEKGLAANMLYLGPTRYEARDEARPGMANVLWLQYFLDNFSTVKNALAAMKDFQIVSAKIAGREWPIHLSLEDATGDSAVVEFVGGRMVVHHGRQYTVMTNEPSFEEQLANLRKYKLFGGKLAMPGDVDPLSRFVRACSYLKTLPKPHNEREAVADIYGVARTIAVPHGAVDTSGSEAEDSWTTLWFSIADLTHKVFYFQSTSSPNSYWVEFRKLKLAPGSPIRAVDAYAPALSGEISALLNSK